MAFSNQFYFVASALTYGSLLSVYGAVACIYNGYQLYRDNLMVPLCCIMMIICWAVEVISLKFARSIGLWFREGEEGRLEREEIKKQKEQSAGQTETKEEGVGGKLALLSSSKEAGGKEEEKSEDKNLQYRALSRIGLRTDAFNTFDSRLSNIHEAPSGFTASEMSFNITVRRRLYFASMLSF
jgi:hypothetical protein